MPSIRVASSYAEYPTDSEYEDFQDRVDIGQQCPSCYVRRTASVAIDMQGALWFHCDACRHEWRDPWKK